MWTRLIQHKGKIKEMGNKKSHADMVIGDKTRGIIMSEMGKYGLSLKVSVTTNIKLGRTSRK